VSEKFSILRLSLQEYKCIAQQWVKKKNGFMLVYSIIDHISFQNLPTFYNLIEEEYRVIFPPLNLLCAYRYILLTVIRRAKQKCRPS
jgi:hypothetical protein